jgi:hypothetical protein
MQDVGGVDQSCMQYRIIIEVLPNVLINCLVIHAAIQCNAAATRIYYKPEPLAAFADLEISINLAIFRSKDSPKPNLNLCFSSTCTCTDGKATACVMRLQYGWEL